MWRFYLLHIFRMLRFNTTYVPITFFFYLFFPLIFGPEWEGFTGTYWTQGRNVGIKRRETRTL